MANNPLVALYAQQAAARHGSSAQIRAAMDGTTDTRRGTDDREGTGSSPYGSTQEAVTTKNADGTETTRTTTKAPESSTTKAVAQMVKKRRAAAAAAPDADVNAATFGGTYPG